MKQESNDIKQVSAQVLSFIAKCTDEQLDSSILKLIIPMLVMGMKEKNTLVRTYSEAALVAVLRLRYGDDSAQVCTHLSNI